MKKGMTMEGIAAGNFAKTTQTLANKAADKVQAGIHGAQDSVAGGANAVSSTVTNAREKVVPVLRQGSGRAQTTAQQGFDALGDIAGQARDMAAGTAESIISYTKRNPVQALAIAVASGALLFAAVKAFRTYRD
jgi:hypothetical protein